MPLEPAYHLPKIKSGGAKRVSRRSLLRTALVGGSGLAAAYVVGCGDGAKPEATQTAAGAPSSQITPTEGALRWRKLSPAGVLPLPRRDHSVVTDGERLLLFGGRAAEALGDLWSYDLATNSWSELKPSGGPSPRFGHNAAFYQFGLIMFVFGGQAGTFFNDLWFYSVRTGNWTELPPREEEPPPPRYGAAGAIDPPGNFRISHGFTNAGRFNDTWSVILAIEEPAWADISPAGTRPIERCLMRGVWDTGRNRFLMFGGQTNGQPFLGDLWALEKNAWREIVSEPKPSPRNFYAMVFDSQSERAIVFGGNSQDGSVNDLWFFDSAGETWSRASAEGEAPSPRYGHDAVWVPAERKFIVFGGHDASGELNDLWELTVPA